MAARLPDSLRTKRCKGLDRGQVCGTPPRRRARSGRLVPMQPPLADYGINGKHLASLRDTSAGFSKWTTLDPFDTAAECRKALVANTKAALNRGEGDQP